MLRFLLPLALMATLLSACATPGADSYCALASPIYVDKTDVFSDETARQILSVNEKWASLCRTPSAR